MAASPDLISELRRAPELRTDRLVLRGWRPGDFEGLAALKADPEVMEFFDAPVSRSETQSTLARWDR